MLIGVDHGNKQIKTVHCNPFVSGLKQSVTRPFGQNVLRYQNTYYTLSTERIPYRKDKTEDDRFFILTLFSTITHYFYENKKQETHHKGFPLWTAS